VIGVKILENFAGGQISHDVCYEQCRQLPGLSYTHCFSHYVTLRCAGARRVYVISQLVYTVGAAAMAVSRHRIAVVLLSVCPGIMYATLFTMPYILVAHYHSTNTVCDTSISYMFIVCLVSVALTNHDL